MRKQQFAFAAASAVLSIIFLVSPSFAAEENHKPCLCRATIRPIDGVTRTTFVATVDYSDPDGDAPARIEITVDDVAYPMRLVKGRAEEGVYRARLTLPEGEHSYYFYTEDSRGLNERYPRYGAKHGPYVGTRKPHNRQAFLTEGGVYFDYGTDKNIYTFTVHYRDRDICRPPRSVRAVVDGIIHEMRLHKGTPNDGIYLYQAAMPAGPHAYYFVATDGDGDCITHPRHGYLRGPEVAETYNSPPCLVDRTLIPNSGSYRTKYAYTVNYRDEDFDAPAIALIYVNDIPHAMKLASGVSYEGLYIYRTGHHVGYSHDYYFYFEDGRGGVCRYPVVGSFHGPFVTR